MVNLCETFVQCSLLLATRSYSSADLGKRSLSSLREGWGERRRCHQAVPIAAENPPEEGLAGRGGAATWLAAVESSLWG